MPDAIKERKDIEDMTRLEFHVVPTRAEIASNLGSDTILESFICHSIVFLPTRREHDSGFYIIEMIAVDRNNKPVCRIAGSTDVVHLDGIGGYGISIRQQPPTLENPSPNTHPSGWTFDCLKKSGLLRMWSFSGVIKIGPALSSLEVFSLQK